MKLLIKKKDEKDLHWPQGLAIYIVCPITHNYKTLAVLNRLFGLWFGMVTGLKIFFCKMWKFWKLYCAGWWWCKLVWGHKGTWVVAAHYAESQPCFKRPKGQMRLKLGGANLSTGYIVLLHQVPSLLAWVLGTQNFYFLVCRKKSYFWGAIHILPWTAC